MYEENFAVAILDVALDVAAERRSSLGASLAGPAVYVRDFGETVEHRPIFSEVESGTNLVSSHYLSYWKLMSKRDPYTSSLINMCKHHYRRYSRV